MTYQVLVYAEATIEVEAESEEQAKKEAEDIVYNNRYAWDVVETEIL